MAPLLGSTESRGLGKTYCHPHSVGACGYLRRFPEKTFLFQVVDAGLIKMSYLGNCGSRFNRASTASIAALPRRMPLLYTWRLSAPTGCSPFQVILLAHSSIVSASVSFVPFHCNSKIPQHRSIGLYLLWYGG